MPEGVEIEMYRQHAERAVGETIASVHAPDAWFIKNDTTEEELVAAGLVPPSPEPTAGAS